MDPWRTRLFLNKLDERIVPDATPLAPPPAAAALSSPADPDLTTCNNSYLFTPPASPGSPDLAPDGGNNAYVTGTAGVASYDFGGDGTGNNAYLVTGGPSSGPSGFLSDPGTSNNSYTPGDGSGNNSNGTTTTAVGDNAHTSGSGVSTYDFGDGSGSGTSDTSFSIPTPPPTPAGPPPWLFPTRQEAIDRNKNSKTKLNELTEVVAGLMLDLIINEREQLFADKDSKDLTLTPAERAAATLELSGLKKKHSELAGSLREAVNEYKEVESDLKKFNQNLNFSVDIEPYNELPEGYLKYAPPISPKKIL